MEKDEVKIAWFGKHQGEEPPLVGMNAGAGGIFFSQCHLRCVFCQNYQISQENLGEEYTIEELAKIMLDLEKDGAVNIDLVTPTIWWKQIKEAILLAKKSGLTLPIVWNSNGYESIKILKEMEGLVDIYLPDFKYGDDEVGFKYSGIKKYSAVALQAIKEMLRQVGYFKTDQNGIGKRGVIVRHLIIPNNIDNSLRALQILTDLDNNLHISLMNQFNPLYKAKQFPEVNRILSAEEFNLVYKHLLDLGFYRGWIQDPESAKFLVPDFTKKDPFNL